MESSTQELDPKPNPFLSLFGSQTSSAVGDGIFKGVTIFFAFLVLVLAFMTAMTLWIGSKDCRVATGWSFLFTQDWDPLNNHYGALPYIYGTLMSAFLALLIATPVGLGISLFLTELAPLKLREPIAFTIEILAAIPSVIYGLWGIFFLAPFMRVHVDPVLAKLHLPFFVEPSTGLSLLSAGVLLAIMILPTLTAVSREVFEVVPNTYREAARALGATRWETMQLAVLKSSKVGILGAVMLALGRALGETMAVTMIIGNTPQISLNLLAPAHSMAAVIANEYTEASSDVYIAALTEIGFLLMVITLILNMLANLLVWLSNRNFQAAGAKR